MFKNKCFLKNALEFNQLENKDMLYISNQRQLSTQEDFTAQKGSNWWMKLSLFVHKMETNICFSD